MLNITPQSNADGAKSYFAKSDYYASADEQEIIGNWGGKGAEMLQLVGKVNKTAFGMLCDNTHPITGEQLTKITRDGRRVGYDFTWSAPKSVSVMHAITGDQAIMEVFRESIADTMREMEADMQARVRKDKQEYDRTTGNLCYAEFVHLVSRPVNGVPCPQLHAHAFTFNLTFDPVEQQWKAGQFGKIKGDAYYWQAVQQARLADGLQKLGYSIRKTKDAFEIDGVPNSALKKFSLRANLIDEVAEKLGITNAKSKAKLAATTREAKDNSVPYHELVELWNRQVTSDELAAIHAIAHSKRQHAPKHDNAAHATFAIKHVFERASVVDERRLLTLALRHGIGEVTPEGVRAEANRHRLLKREKEDKTWVTTREVLAEESRMLEFAVKGKRSCKPVAELGELRFKEERLNEAQLRAVEHVLTSPDRVLLIRGAAGTGKTTLTREAVAQLEERGRSVVMLAPSAEASRGVLRAEGFKEADTLARFLLDEKLQAMATDGFIWLDEAGLVGTPSLVKLFDVAEKYNARVVISGDKRQMASVERGTALHVLESIAHLSVAEVTEIQRQKPQAYRDAVALLSKGNVEEGFDQLDAMGCVKELPEVDSYLPIARDFIAAVRDGVSALIVSPTHAEGELITSAVRSQLKNEGLLSIDEQTFTRLVPKQWTAAEKGDLKQYTGDEVLLFHHNTATFKAGERVLASEAMPKLVEAKPEHFSVYDAEQIGLCVGDSIRLTGGGKTMDGKHKLNNGAVYQIARFTNDGNIVLSNQWVISKDFGQLNHGYVSTAYAAQGRTVDRVLVSQSSMSYPATGPENFYVSASRGRQSVTVFTDDKHGLRDAIKRSRPRLSATELANMPKPQFLQRMRRSIAKLQQASLIAMKRAAAELAHTFNPREPLYER